MEDHSRCRGCMNQRNEELFCPNCGYRHDTPPESPIYIQPGTVINQYVFGKVLGHGGFGVTYIGYDQANNRKVAIKEYLPAELATRNSNALPLTIFTGEKAETFRVGIEKFKKEAATIQEFTDFPGIVDGYDVFEANNTAYFVMEYIEGVTLKDYIAQKGGKLPFNTVRAILVPIMDALSEMHRKSIIHRDISPDNIYITQDKQVKLLDFGAARQAIGEQNKSLSVVLKHGFTPKEQYFTKGNQGAWTDVYALGATAYYMLTGKVPQPALDRLEQDKLLPISSFIYDINPEIDRLFSRVLAIEETNRFQTIDIFKEAILNFDPAAKPYSQSQSPYGATAYQPNANAVPPQVQPPQATQPQQSSQSLQPQYPPQPNIAGQQPQTPKKKTNKGLIAALIAVPVFLVVMITVVLLAFVIPKTPDLGNMTEEEAISYLEDKGFDYDVEYDTDEKIDAGEVADQEPAAKKLTFKKYVSFVVSRGPKELDVPDVLKSSKEEATALLEKNGFELSTEEAYSLEPEGTIISESPEPGTTVKNGSELKLMVSKGQDPNWVTFEDANLEKAIIDALSLTVDLTKEKISKDMIDKETELYLYDSDIKSLEGIKAFDKLEYLTCSGCKLTAIPDLPLGITSVDFSNNEIASADLSRYTDLYSVTLSGNKLTKLPKLPVSIGDLYLFNNQIDDLTGLEGLTNLYSLDVSSNMITDFTPLDAIFSNLSYCYTDGNPTVYASSSTDTSNWANNLAPTYTESDEILNQFPDDNGTYYEFINYNVADFAEVPEITYYGDSDRDGETFSIYTYEDEGITVDFYANQTNQDVNFADVYGQDLPLFGEYDLWCLTDTYEQVISYFGQPYDYGYADDTVSMYYVTTDMVYCFVCNQSDGIISFMRVFDKDYFFK